MKPTENKMVIVGRSLASAHISRKGQDNSPQNKIDLIAALTKLMNHPLKGMILIGFIVIYVIVVLSECVLEENNSLGTKSFTVLYILRILDLICLIMFLVEIMLHGVVEGIGCLKVFVNVADILTISISLCILSYAIQNQTSNIISNEDGGLRTILRAVRVVIIFNRMHRAQIIYASIKQARQDNVCSTNLDAAILLLNNLKNNYLIESALQDDIEWVIHMLASNDLNVSISNEEKVLKGHHEDIDGDEWVRENFGLGVSRKNTVTGSGGLHPALKVLEDRISSHDEFDGVTDGGFIAALQSQSLLNEDHVQEWFIKVNDWNSDIFALDRITGGHPVLFMAFVMLKKYNLFEIFDLQEDVARRYFACTEAGYRTENEYHNRIHAADVMQTAYVFLLQDEFRRTLLVQDILSIAIATAVHDYDHPGVNNAFLIATKSEVSLLYNDKSVLENHHCAGAFFLMRQKERNILGSLSRELEIEVRDTIISMVLATDMKVHFEEVGKFNAFMKDFSTKDSDFSYPLKDRQLLLRMALHTADVSNPSKSFEVMKEWTTRVMNEFFKQGDAEKALGLPVSQFMDRTDTTSVSKCQIAFITYIVQPTFEAWCKLTVGLNSVIMGNLTKTIAHWKDPGKAVTPNSLHIKIDEADARERARSVTPMSVDKFGPSIDRSSPLTEVRRKSSDKILVPVSSAVNIQDPVRSKSRSTVEGEEIDVVMIDPPFLTDVPIVPSTRTLTELHDHTKRVVPPTPKTTVVKGFRDDEDEGDENRPTTL